MGPILFPFLQDAKEDRLETEAAARMEDRGLLLLPAYIEYAKSLPQRHDTVPLLPGLHLLVQHPIIHDIILEDRPATAALARELSNALPEIIPSIQATVAQAKEVLLAKMKGRFPPEADIVVEDLELATSAFCFTEYFDEEDGGCRLEETIHCGWEAVGASCASRSADVGFSMAGFRIVEMFLERFYGPNGPKSVTAKDLDMQDLLYICTPCTVPGDGPEDPPGHWTYTWRALVGCVLIMSTF